MRTIAICVALFLSGAAAGATVDHWLSGAQTNLSYIATSLLISVIVMASAIHTMNRRPDG